MSKEQTDKLVEELGKATDVDNWMTCLQPACVECQHELEEISYSNCRTKYYLLPLLARNGLVFVDENQGTIGTPRACKEEDLPKMIEWMNGYKYGQKVLIDNQWRKVEPVQEGINK